MERARLLDIPAGAGGESARLERMGFEVVSADLYPPSAGAPAPRWVRADCNAPLPFRTGAFDAVLSREGIEHFENQAGFVRECARVLRPGRPDRDYHAQRDAPERAAERDAYRAAHDAPRAGQ